MILLPPPLEMVADFSEYLACTYLASPSPSPSVSSLRPCGPTVSVALSIDGFHLPPSQSMDVIRDGDTITVRRQGMPMSETSSSSDTPLRPSRATVPSLPTAPKEFKPRAPKVPLTGAGVPVDPARGQRAPLTAESSGKRKRASTSEAPPGSTKSSSEPSSMRSFPSEPPGGRRRWPSGSGARHVRFTEEGEAVEGGEGQSNLLPSSPAQAMAAKQWAPPRPSSPVVPPPPSPLAGWRGQIPR